MSLMRNVSVLTMLAVLLACQPALAGPPAWGLRFDGIGPLKVGMDFIEAGRALGQTLVHTEPALLATRGCDMIGLPGHKGVWLMFIDDVLKRIDVEGGARTVEGIGTGDPVARVFTAYAAVEREPNAYDSSERYLTVRSPDRASALRFETDKGKVGHFYAGDPQAIRYIEGCL
jgi:hypothetical protein